MKRNNRIRRAFFFFLQSKHYLFSQIHLDVVQVNVHGDKSYYYCQLMVLELFCVPRYFYTYSIFNLHFNSESWVLQMRKLKLREIKLLAPYLS